MIERGQGGYVLNTASGAGLVGGPNVLYTSTKHAVVGLSESLRLEADRYDIGVSVLCPGPVATQIISNTEVIAGDIPVTHRNHGELESSLSKGRSIDEVGEIVVAGIEARAMWIHTDDVVKPYVQMRMEALLESFPTPVGSAS
jgi:short-subunit dehydrogenase